MNAEEMKVDVNHDGLTTTVLVELDGELGVGVARCRPTDVFVRETGARIALGRALRDLGFGVEAKGLDESVGTDEVERVVRAITRQIGDVFAAAMDAFRS